MINNQSNMFIEQSSGWCCCNTQQIYQQKLLEQSTQSFLSSTRKNRSPTINQIKSPEKDESKKIAFSFKNYQNKVTSPKQLDKNIVFSSNLTNVRNPLQTKFMLDEEKNKINKNSIISQNVNQDNRMNSPRVIYVQKMRSPPSKIISNLYAVKVEPQRIKNKFPLNFKECPGKMQGKRIKTAEEQTEYSSIHSQIFWRNSNEETQNSTHLTFNKKGSNGTKSKNTIFHQYIQSQKSLQQFQFPSCRQVSAREQADISLSNEHIQNLRSIQTIGTSPELRSKRTSREPSNTLTFAKLFQSPNCLSPRQSSEIPELPMMKNHRSATPCDLQLNSPRVKTNIHQTVTSPVKNTSLGLVAQKMEGSKLNSSIFYNQETSKRKASSPRVSYLSILNIDDKESDEEQLRDVMDQDILTGKGFSKTSSPFASVNQSLKNVEQRKEKKVNFVQDSNDSQNSYELGNSFKLLTQVRFSQKRTNTFESMDTSFSQKSLLDIKFMQKHRSRREVSKLIRE